MTSTVLGASDRTFFGEPRGLAFLSFTEAWERFSFYGMGALMVLYMTQQLLLTGHVENIVGYASLRTALESVFGPMSTLALASQIKGLYSGLIYFTPVFGGWIADRFLGRRTAVVVGAAMMSAGHLAMAFDQSFLFALLLLISGCGLLKGNISTQVGELYREDDDAGRTRGFAIFSMAINVGAFVGPLLCGLLAQLYGWHAGFGLAAALMLMGLFTYLAGLKYVVDKPRQGAIATAGTEGSRRDWRIVLAIGVVAFITIFQSIGFYQNTIIGLVWIDRSVDLDLLGFHIPVAWFGSIDALASIVGVPFLITLWRWQDKNGGAPDDLAKIGIGAWITVAANALLAVAAATMSRVPAIFPLVYNVLLGIGFLYYWPILLALVSRTAPSSVKATLMGAVFLSLFVANFIIGYIGSFYERMTPAAFWGMEASISAIGGVLAFVLARPSRRPARSCR
ncbi:MAG: peptide MFS transporter [Proteobacteria bacterium]|nr:peptide MFS transporter [Pseudomonadota bacterium]